MLKVSKTKEKSSAESSEDTLDGKVVKVSKDEEKSPLDDDKVSKVSKEKGKMEY